MYYWAIKWKKYGEADLYVTDKQKEYIEAEWVKEPEQRQSQQFKIKGEYYRYDSIDSIQRSTKRVEENVKMLYADNTPVKRAPLTAKEDDYEVVVTQWIKKYISPREWENDYSKRGYKLLSKDDAGVWIAMRIAVYEDGYLPENTEVCDEAESDRLWKSLKEH